MLQNRDNNNKWRNPGFAIFFHLSVIMNVGISTFGAIKYQSELFHADLDIVNFKIRFKDIIYILSVLGISITFTIIWLLLMLSCSKTIIKFSLISEVVLWFGFAIIILLINPLAAIFPLIIGVIRLVFVIWCWKFIPFCQALFMVALSVFKKYWYPVLLHLLMSFIALIILVIDILSFFTLNKIFHADPNHISLFSFGFIELVFIYWHANALTAVCHMTSCGVMLQHLNKQSLNMWNKFKLSVTKLFGVICFGTFIEAVLWALRVILGQQERSAANNGNLLQFCCICCLRCLLKIIGDILEYINSYTYVYAIKNETDYIASAKSVFNMFKNTGFLSLINEWILFSPLHIGLLLVMFVNAGCFALGKVADVNVYSAVIGCGLGIVVYSLMMEVIRSYIKTVFVVWAEDRHIFATNQPEYSRILDEAIPAGAIASTDQNGNEFQVDSQ